MRATWMGAVLGVAVIGLLLAEQGVTSPHTPQPQHPTLTASSPATNQTQAFSFTTENGDQLITLIDGASHSMAVYRVEPKTGKISLRSVRNLSWDLQMEEFNSEPPSPSEIRAMQIPPRRGMLERMPGRGP